LLVLLGYLRQQRLMIGIYTDVLNFCKDIASETAIELTHEEIGILRRHGRHEKICFYDKLRHDISVI
jgi:hypothetical protein